MFTEAHNAKCEAGGASPCDTYNLIVENVGSKASEGEITVTGGLGSDVHVVALEGLPGDEAVCEPTTVTCTFSNSVGVGGWLMLRVAVTVESDAPGSIANSITVSGGGAETVEASSEVKLGAQLPAFGVEQFSFEATGFDGKLDEQAGDHPNLVTVKALVPNVRDAFNDNEPHVPVESIRNLNIYLPVGFLGNPQVTPRCPEAEIATGGASSACPAASRVGVVVPFIFGQAALLGVGETIGNTNAFPIYNVKPDAGYPAEFAFPYNSLTVAMYASVVRRHGIYVLRISVPGVPRVAKLNGFIASFFGNVKEASVGPGGVIQEHNTAAFLTNPAACSSTPLTAEVEVDSWEKPGVESSGETIAFPSIKGCEELRLEPRLEAKPDNSLADEPASYGVNLTVPQAPNIFPNRATPPVKDVQVQFPAGVAVSPSAASGLVSCEETGPDGINLEASGLGADSLPHSLPGSCPGASQLASVEITSPLLSEHLTGHIYLARPGCGNAGQAACTPTDAQDGNLIRLYLEAEAPVVGVNIKLAGQGTLNVATGQITATFQGNPQFPFESLVVTTQGGPQAPLANPQSCGGFVTNADISAWSAPFTPDAGVSAPMAIGGCLSPAGLSPEFSAGTVLPVAGGFTPFTMTIRRHDREQDLAGLTLHTPPGLLGKISGVPQCPAAQAAAGTCGAASLIGHTTVSAGSGSQPLWETGSVYLTGPYNGGPFGLSIVVPAVAGPFNLGNVIVRASIRIDPNTAALTVVSDPLPQIIDGVPLRVQTINVTVDRPNFMLNPTSCSAASINATVGGTEGAQPQVASSFAATGCRNLPFKPGFTASTAAQTTKANGASLRVNVASASGQANIAKVRVALPKQLPSRLTTLQKACTDAVFNVNPAGCPAASLVGSAVAKTPILNQPLSGPAYLVSHGGAAFPDLVIVLQGEGVTLYLDGKTDIKKGITTSTFNTVPDAPITSFALNLPQGPHSALAANLPEKAKRNLCGQKLAMPTTITGQNGAVVTQTTNISIAPCSKHKAKRPVKKHKKPHARKRASARKA